jgi:carboxymethylenebutenolidase
MIIPVFLFLFSAFLSAQQKNMKEIYGDTIPRQEMVSLKYDNREVDCYLTFPEDHENEIPGMIVIHEDWGLTDWVRSVSDEIASLGYIVIAPDLLSGFSPEETYIVDLMNEDIARQALLEMNQNQITSDLDAAYSYLRGHSFCSGKIMVIGFSWGGSQAFHYMTMNPDIAAGFIFYGKSPSKNKILRRVVAPVYGFYGEYDSGINATLRKTKRKMTRLGKTFKPLIFEGGGHGFMRSGGRPGANEGNIKARSAALKRLKELLIKI